jgi:hypothetical protein
MVYAFAVFYEFTKAGWSRCVYICYLLYLSASLKAELSPFVYLCVEFAVQLIRSEICNCNVRTLCGHCFVSLYLHRPQIIV